MAESQDLVEYKQQLRKNLKSVAPIFAKATVGDFSKDVKLPEKDDDLTVFLVGVQIILDSIREKTNESDSRMTRLNAANEQLEHDKAVYHASLSSIAEGLIVVDKDGRITLMNESAGTLLGLEPKKLTSEIYFEKISIKDKQGNIIATENTPLYKAIKSGKKKITDLTDGLGYVKSNGDTLPVSITASPVKIGENVIGGVIIFRDISDEYLLDQSKSEIISIASHQLRTPLTAIKWLSEQLLLPVNKLSLRKRRHKLKQIYESNERMISLVNDLLNVSRIDLNKIVYEPKAFDLSKLINDILNDLKGQIKSRHLTIVKKVDIRLKEVTSDPRHLQVILQNLISNAVKYSFDKKHVHINAKLEDKKIKIMVSDEGCGIPLSQQKNVFGKLFRADNAKQMSGEGSGLGLYVAKAMTEQLHGKISFTSEENKGTAFFVTIPVREAKK